MCYFIESDVFLAVLLKKKESITFHELRILRDKLLDEFPEYCIDISGQSLKLALRYYPTVFAKADKKIVRAKNSEKLFDSKYIDDEFLSTVPHEIISNLEKAV